MHSKCPCGNEASYEACCKPYHQGKLPPTAESLMRSRYSAYTLNLPDYIIETTHPASPEYMDNRTKWRRQISEFSRGSDFTHLDILDVCEGEHTATVVFTAHLLQHGEDASFSEQSYFEKRKGKWLYRAGKMVSGKTPNWVTNHQMKLLPIAYYDNPILRQKAAPIHEITEEIRTLIENMDETMLICDGMGLAAPQVHHSLQIFIMRPPEEDELGEFQLGDLKVMINPKIISSSQETSVISEGCLSIPKIYGNVTRPKEINIEYQDLNGTMVQEKLTGWSARIAQHEMDHLLGVLFIDHLSQADKQQIAPHLQKLTERMADEHKM